jgi:hypothetical protein
MTENYLRSLGFEDVSNGESAKHKPTHEKAWRYRHTNAAADGTHLYAEHPLGIARCRLSTLAAPLDQADVLLDIDLHNQAALAAAVTDFFTAHGGIGSSIAAVSGNTFLPFRRRQ